MTTGLPVFDTTLQQTNEWLRAIESGLDCSRQEAYSALRAVLHVLRDRLTIDMVLGLSAQLPMLLRGVYFEGWQPHLGILAFHDATSFTDAVSARLSSRSRVDPQAATEAVLSVVAGRIDPDEVTKILAHLPEPLRMLWPDDCRVM